MLMAQDMDQAIAFYTDVVGLEVKYRSPDWTELAYGDAVVALHGGGDGDFKGTGLGLPIVKTILDRHHATITVQSLVDEGTRFTLSFPALGAPSALEKEAKP